MNELPEIQRFLAAHAPFSVLPADAVEKLSRHVSISYQPKETLILKADEPCEELFVLRTGAVGFYDDSGNMIEKRANGDVFTNPLVRARRKLSCDVKTLEDSLLYHVPLADIEMLRRTHTEFDDHFSDTMGTRVSLALKKRPEFAISGVTVETIMSSPPVCCDETDSIQAVAQKMRDKRVSSLLVCAPNGDLQGIVTDRDLRNRVVAAGMDISLSVQTIMTSEVLKISPRETVMQALLLMMDSGIHHLPVVDGDRPVGLLTSSDIFNAENDQPVFLLQRIRRQNSVEKLIPVIQDRAELFANLEAMGASAEQMGQFMTAVIDGATRRLLQLAEEKLGPPPLPYCWLCFGSQARAEQSIKTDQDNGLLLAEEPDPDQAEYFVKLAAFVCDGLNAAGIIWCPGDVMAKNPQWRMSLAGWQQQFANWIDEPDPKPLMYASIFFDMRALVGPKALFQQLQDDVLQRARRQSIFRRFMLGNALQYTPPLGFFRQFILDLEGEEHDGISLKKRGVGPIVALVRLRALEHGISAVSTTERLQQLAIKEPESAADFHSLKDAFELIGHWRMQGHAQQFRSQSEWSNWLNPEALSALERRHLKAAFGVVRTAQKAAALRYRL